MTWEESGEEKLRYQEHQSSSSASSFTLIVFIYLCVILCFQNSTSSILSFPSLSLLLHSSGHTVSKASRDFFHIFFVFPYRFNFFPISFSTSSPRFPFMPRQHILVFFCFFRDFRPWFVGETRDTLRGSFVSHAKSTAATCTRIYNTRRCSRSTLVSPRWIK
jgi:hypothetical protein